MNTYTELKDKQQERVNAFLSKYAFFAFSQQQFKEGLQRLGVPEDAERVLVSLGNVGGFLLKDKLPEYRALMEGLEQETQEAIEDPETGAAFAVQMFTYELANHEYSITGDLTETLDALGYTTEDINNSPVLKQALSEACAAVLKDA